MIEILQKRLLTASKKPTGSLLPKEYQQVEWIGTQDFGSSNAYKSYIKTPFKPTNETEVEIDVCVTKISRPVNICASLKFYIGTDTTFYTYQFGIDVGESNIYNSNIAVTDFDGMTTLKLSKYGYFINGVKSNVDIPQNTWIDYGNFCVFGYPYRGSTLFCGSNIRCSKLIYRENGVEQMYLIPCYRKSDGVIGMYDLCGSVCDLTGSPFYTNSGTVEFLKGDDV